METYLSDWADYLQLAETLDAPEPDYNSDVRSTNASTHDACFSSSAAGSLKHEADAKTAPEEDIEAQVGSAGSLEASNAWTERDATRDWPSLLNPFTFAMAFGPSVPGTDTYSAVSDTVTYPSHAEIVRDEEDTAFLQFTYDSCVSTSSGCVDCTKAASPDSAHAPGTGFPVFSTVVARYHANTGKLPPRVHAGCLTAGQPAALRGYAVGSYASVEGVSGAPLPLVPPPCTILKSSPAPGVGVPPPAPASTSPAGMVDGDSDEEGTGSTSFAPQGSGGQDSSVHLYTVPLPPPVHVTENHRQLLRHEHEAVPLPEYPSAQSAAAAAAGPAAAPAPTPQHQRRNSPSGSFFDGLYGLPGTGASAIAPEPASEPEPEPASETAPAAAPAPRAAPVPASVPIAPLAPAPAREHDGPISAASGGPLAAPPLPPPPSYGGGNVILRAAPVPPQPAPLPLASALGRSPLGSAPDAVAYRSDFSGPRTRGAACSACLLSCRHSCGCGAGMHTRAALHGYTEKSYTYLHQNTNNGLAAEYDQSCCAVGCGNCLARAARHPDTAFLPFVLGYLDHALFRQSRFPAAKYPHGAPIGEELEALGPALSSAFVAPELEAGPRAGESRSATYTYRDEDSYMVYDGHTEDFKYAAHCFADAVRSPLFLALPVRALQAFAASNDVRCSEFVLFQALVRWARFRLHAHGLDSTDPRLVRLELGPLLSLIRFARFTPQEAALLAGAGTPETALLTPRELSLVWSVALPGGVRASGLKDALRRRGDRYDVDAPAAAADPLPALKGAAPAPEPPAASAGGPGSSVNAGVSPQPSQQLPQAPRPPGSRFIADSSDDEDDGADAISSAASVASAAAIEMQPSGSATAAAAARQDDMPPGLRRLTAPGASEELYRAFARISAEVDGRRGPLPPPGLPAPAPEPPVDAAAEARAYARVLAREALDTEITSGYNPSDAPATRLDAALVTARPGVNVYTRTGATLPAALISNDDTRGDISTGPVCVRFGAHYLRDPYSRYTAESLQMIARPPASAVPYWDQAPPVGVEDTVGGVDAIENWPTLRPFDSLTTSADPAAPATVAAASAGARRTDIFASASATRALATPLSLTVATHAAAAEVTRRAAVPAQARLPQAESGLIPLLYSGDSVRRRLLPTTEEHRLASSTVVAQRASAHHAAALAGHPVTNRPAVSAGSSAVAPADEPAYPVRGVYATVSLVPVPHAQTKQSVAGDDGGDDDDDVDAMLPVIASHLRAPPVPVTTTAGVTAAVKAAVAYQFEPPLLPGTVADNSGVSGVAIHLFDAAEEAYTAPTGPVRGGGLDGSYQFSPHIGQVDKLAEAARLGTGDVGQPERPATAIRTDLEHAIALDGARASIETALSGPLYDDIYAVLPPGEGPAAGMRALQVLYWSQKIKPQPAGHVQSKAESELAAEATFYRWAAEQPVQGLNRIIAAKKFRGGGFSLALSTMKAWEHAMATTGTHCNSYYTCCVSCCSMCNVVIMFPLAIVLLLIGGARFSPGYTFPLAVIVVSALWLAVHVALRRTCCTTEPGSQYKDTSLVFFRDKSHRRLVDSDTCPDHLYNHWREQPLWTRILTASALFLGIFLAAVMFINSCGVSLGLWYFFAPVYILIAINALAICMPFREGPLWTHKRRSSEYGAEPSPAAPALLFAFMLQVLVFLILLQVRLGGTYIDTWKMFMPFVPSGAVCCCGLFYSCCSDSSDKCGICCASMWSFLVFGYFITFVALWANKALNPDTGLWGPPLIVAFVPLLIGLLSHVTTTMIMFCSFNMCPRKCCSCVCCEDECCSCCQEAEVATAPPMRLAARMQREKDEMTGYSFPAQMFWAADKPDATEVAATFSQMQFDFRAASV